MARVLLINPPFYRLLGSHYNANSLGIAYIAAVLNANGHDAWLYNADYVDREDYKNLTGLIEGFQDYTEFFRDESSEIWTEIANEIIRFNPCWIGYTSYTANLGAIRIISKKVRQLDNNIKQVIGGVHATLEKNILDKLPDVDYSVRREGEFPMLSLVNGEPARTIEGVMSRTNNGLQDNGITGAIADIDALPFPERDKLWGLSGKEKETIDVSYICSIRGCPYKCTYCASPFHWERDKTRFRSPTSIINEMVHLKENYWNKKEYDFSASANIDSKSNLIIRDNTIVYFVDDIFTVRKKRVKEILREIISLDLRMPWKCEARADHLDDEICELMAEAGCQRVKIGFESGSDRILKTIKKLETKDEMLAGVKMLKRAGVPFTAYFMTGFPGETDDDLRQTINFAKQIEADYYSLSILAPYYGTELYQDILNSGVELEKEPWEYFFHQLPEPLVNGQLSPNLLAEYLSLSEANPDTAGYK